MGLPRHASSSLSVPVGSLALSSLALTLSLKAVWHWDRGPQGHSFFWGCSRLLWAVADRLVEQ